MKILINGCTWNIEEVESNNSLLLAGDTRCKGTAHFFHQKIYLDITLSQDSKYSTLCHELAHAFIYETQISQPKNYSEEDLCEFVGIYSKQIIAIANQYFLKKEQ